MELHKNTYIFRKEIKSTLKIRLLNALIKSIMIYSLHIIPLSNNDIQNLQSSYSKIIRKALSENYDTINPLKKLKTNTEIRIENNIPAIHSQLEYLRIRLYLKWKKHISFPYLNNKIYINESLNKLDTIKTELSDIFKIEDDYTKIETYLETKVAYNKIPNNRKLNYIHKIKGIIENNHTPEDKLEHILTEIILDIKDINTESGYDYELKYKCNFRESCFSSRQKIHHRIKRTPFCYIQYEIGKHTLTKCDNCNTWWNTESGKHNHMNYHCRLSDNERNYFHYNDESLKRNSNRTFGLPKQDQLYNNGKVKYGCKLKLWKCTICNYQRNQFNRTQVMRHVDTKHGKKVIQTKELIKKRGMRIENEIFDEALQREIDYGRIKTYQIYDEHNQKWVKEHVCQNCGFSREKKIGILVHLARKHNELGKHYDLNWLYCPGIFRTLQSLNRHLRKPTCKIIKQKRHELTLFGTLDWIKVWNDICQTNRLLQD